MKKTIGTLFGLIALIAATAPVQAVEGGAIIATAYVETVGVTSIPVGHADYCDKRPDNCQVQIGTTDLVALSGAEWDQLQAVNNHFNTTIIPASDADLYGVDEFWTYPTSGYGDCEDYVLAKRAALIEMGWDSSVLLITVVRQANGEGHAVLTVRTDRGDLILDNQDGLIQLWTDTPYTYLKRQSQAHAGQWVDLVDPRGDVLVALR